MRKPTERQFNIAIEILERNKKHLQQHHPAARNEIQAVNDAIISLIAWRDET